MFAIKPYFLIEEDYQSKASIKGLFDADSYEYLLEHQYLNLSSNGLLAFKYVGVVSIGTELICVLPKYYRGVDVSFEEKRRQFRTILKVLKKIEKFDFIPDISIQNNSSDSISEITIADYLIRDYLDRGFFQKRRDESIVNSNGEVNWDRTITGIDPIISKRRPIYHEQYSFNNITEEYNIITELHKWAIKYCIVKYGDILDYNFHFSTDTIASYKELGTMGHLLGILEREIGVTYIDRETKVLVGLHNLLKKKGQDGDTNINLYGTGYFNIAWEKVCASTFSNKRDLFTNLIPRPKWHLSENEFIEKDSLNPDIIATNNEETIFFIFDAKYYNFRATSFPTTSISGNPGIGDITKQILYEKAFSSAPIDKKLNAFLFPGIVDTSFEIKGYVTFELLREHKVYNIVLNPNVLFKAYIQNESLGEQLLCLFMKGIDFEA